MHRSLFSVLLAVPLALAACGGAPKEGDSCNESGYLCSDQAAALECRAGMWTRLPCRGSGGCQRDGDTVKCDMSANLVGDACASSTEGKGLCNASGTATLECRQGFLVQTNSCKTCTVSGEQVVCQP